MDDCYQYYDYASTNQDSNRYTIDNKLYGLLKKMHRNYFI